MKFCTQQQILNWMNVTWSKMKKVHSTDSEFDRTYFLISCYWIIISHVNERWLMLFSTCLRVCVCKQIKKWFWRCHVMRTHASVCDCFGRCLYVSMFCWVSKNQEPAASRLVWYRLSSQHFSISTILVINYSQISANNCRYVPILIKCENGLPYATSSSN